MSLLERKEGRDFAVAAFLCMSFTIQARADVVLDWNATAAALPIPAPPVMARAMAAMHGAMHDAINAIEPRYEFYRGALDAAPGASKDAAVASAAHGVLVALVPVQRPALDAALTASLSRVADAGDIFISNSPAADFQRFVSLVASTVLPVLSVSNTVQAQ